MKAYRGVDAATPSQNRFRRLVELCGLSVKEAAVFLEISEATVQSKMKGSRGITEREEAELASLWRAISNRTVRLDWSVPAGAVRRQVALIEVLAIAAGEDVPDDLMPDAGAIAAADNDAEVEREVERHRKQGRLQDMPAIRQAVERQKKKEGGE